MKLIIADDHELLLDTLVQSLSLRFTQLEIKKVKNKVLEKFRTNILKNK